MLADLALMVAVPLTLSALLLGELTMMLQVCMLSVVVPVSMTSVTLPWSSAMTQFDGPPPVAAPGAATARAEMVGSAVMKRAANINCCGCWMRTSTAWALPVLGPDSGGLLTATV